MKRQIFCYLSIIFEIIFLTIFALVMIYAYNNDWNLGRYTKLLTLDAYFLLFMTLPLFITLLFFGTPKNKVKMFKIQPILLHLFKDDIITFNYINEKKNWICKYNNRVLEFDFSGWINEKQRIIDIIYIQLHNLNFNTKKLNNSAYIKRIKINIKVKFEKNGFYKIKKIKPSWILKLKMLLAISQFRNHKVPQNEHWKRDLYDTFLIVE